MLHTYQTTLASITHICVAITFVSTTLISSPFPSVTLISDDYLNYTTFNFTLISDHSCYHCIFFRSLWSALHSFQTNFVQHSTHFRLLYPALHIHSYSLITFVSTVHCRPSLSALYSFLTTFVSATLIADHSSGLHSFDSPFVIITFDFR